MSKKNEVPARQKEFLETGAALATKVGIVNVTRRAIAEAHDVTDPLVGKHVGGKAELQAGIKRTMKRLGLKEPDAKTVAEKGIALRARKDTKPLKKVVAKKSVPAAKKKAASTSSKVVKKAINTKRGGNVKDVPLPADPKKGAPSRKAKFPTKAPPLPALPNLGE